MPNPKGPHTQNVLIAFTSNVSVSKADLDKAIMGAVGRSGVDRSDKDLRDEILAIVYLGLVTFFAEGKTLEGKITSLAYTMAYRAAMDTYRRPDGYTKFRARNIEVADAIPAAGFGARIETAEERLLRLAHTKTMAGKLAAALSKVRTTDRRALIEMLERREPLSRETAIERKTANAIAQREKRARDRLSEAVRFTKESG